MDDLFNKDDMTLAVSGFTLRGRAIDVFRVLNILGTTEKIESDPNWWAVRARVLAHGMDRRKVEPIEYRLN